MADIQVGDQVTIVHRDVVLICEVVAVRPSGHQAASRQQQPTATAQAQAQAEAIVRQAVKRGT